MAVLKEDRGDAPSGTTTPYTMRLGDVFRGALDGSDSWASLLKFYFGVKTRSGDHSDTVRVELKAGTRYEISVDGVGPDGLADPKLKIFDQNGKRVAFNNDGVPDGNSKLVFKPPEDGTYYIGVSGGRRDSGDYEISFKPAGPVTYEEIADYLIDGYHSVGATFDLGPDRTLDVDITGLTAVEQNLARWALEAWSHVADFRFRFVDGNADITFTNVGVAGWAWPEKSGSTITKGTVNFSSNWAGPQRDSDIGTRSYFTALHEIGHVLGLGHAGPYPRNGDGGLSGRQRYQKNALFQNDS